VSRTLRLRMLPWALALPLLKHLMPLPRLTALLQTRRGSRHPVEADDVLQAANAAWKVVPRKNCLEQGLLLYRYLSWGGFEPTLVVGLRPEGGRLCGHAWVTIGEAVVGDSPDEVARHVPVVSFGPRGVESLAAASPGLSATGKGEADPVAEAALSARPAGA
jgi:hypothetical protein